MQCSGSIDVASNAQNLDSPLMEQTWTVALWCAFDAEYQKTDVEDDE